MPGVQKALKQSVCQIIMMRNIAAGSGAGV